MALYVLDSAQNAIGVIGSFTNDQHVQDISLGGSTFTFDVNKDEDCAKYLKTGNYLIMQDNLSRNWAFYILRTVSDQQVITVTSCDAGITLINRMMDVDNETTPQPIEYYVNNIIKGTQWTIGVNEISDMKEALQFNNRETGLQRLLNVLQGFNNAEVEFEVELSGLHVTKWLLNIRKQLGTVRNDLEIDYNDTLTDIIKTEDRSSFVTALEGTSENTSSAAPKKDDSKKTDNKKSDDKKTDDNKKGALSLVALSGAQKVIADAEKYLGVPYLWGGHNKSNPFAGMDCSGFVSQVYYDFGINIPAYTVSMESCGYEVPMSDVTTGDMLFYGPHGATHHVALALDNKNMIFEPQPGEVCKKEPISDYPPNFAIRNKQMYAIVEGNSGNSNNNNNNSQASQTDSQASQAADSVITLNNTTYSDADYFLSGGWLYAKTNNNLYNNGNPYIESFFDDSTATSAQELLNDTLQQLKTISVPAVSYQCNVAIVDPTLKLGDTVRIVDHTFNPPCYLKARVIQLTRSYSDNSQNQVVFGNFQEIQSKISSSLKNLQGEIQNLKNGISANASDISNVSSAVTNVSSAVTSAVKHVDSVSSNVSSMEKQLSGIHYHVASIGNTLSQAGNHGNTNYYGDKLESGTSFKKGDLDFVTDPKTGKTTIYIWTGSKWEKLVDDSDDSQVSAIVASAEKAVAPMVSEANSAVSAADANIKKVFGTLDSQQKSVSSLSNQMSTLNNSMSGVVNSANKVNNSLISQADSLVSAVSANGLSIKTNANTLNIYDADIQSNAGSITAIQDNLNGIQTTVVNYKNSTDQEISSIKQTAQNIQTNVIDNSNKIGTLSTSVQQNANQINTTVEQVTKQVTENINQNQVINYIANSELIVDNKDIPNNPSLPKDTSFREPYCWHSNGWDVTVGQDFNFATCIEINCAQESSWHGGYDAWSSDPIPKIGNVFSASVRLYIQRQDFFALSIRSFDSNDQELNEWGFNLDLSKTYQWQLATMENVTIPDNVVYLKLFVYSEPQSIDSYHNLIIEINKPMLTFTSKLYTYTPSKEDFVQGANNRDYVQTCISTVNQTIKGISMTVSQNTQTGNTNTSKISQLNTSVDGISANVSQLQNGVTQKVSSINQNIDTINSTIADFKSGITTKYSNLEQKVDGFQTTVNQVGDMSSRIDQLSNTIQSTVTSVNNNQTQITQLSNDIDLRISKAIQQNGVSAQQVVAEINASDSGVYIKGAHIHLDGQTVIDQGIIKDADIASLSADKITSGTIDAGTINVVNINGANIQSHTVGANQLVSNDILVALQGSLTHVDIQPDSLTILKDTNDPIIQLNTSGLMINGSNNQQVFKLDQSGITVSNPYDQNNSMIGLFHVNHIYQHPEWAGIDLDLNPDYGGKYIGFGCYHDNTQFYDLEFGYTEDPDIFKGNTGIICNAPTTFLDQIYFTNTFIRVPGVGTEIMPMKEDFWFNNHHYTGIGFVTNNGGSSNGIIVTDQGEPFFVRYNSLYPLKGILQTEGYPGF